MINNNYDDGDVMMMIMIINSNENLLFAVCKYTWGGSATVGFLEREIAAAVASTSLIHVSFGTLYNSSQLSFLGTVSQNLIQKAMCVRNIFIQFQETVNIIGTVKRNARARFA